MPPLPRYRTHPQLLDHACDVLRNGGTRVAAASAIRVHFATLENWIAEDAAVRNRIERAEQEREAAGARPAALAPPRARPATGDDRWAKVREDAEVLAYGLFGYLLAAEVRFQAAKFPPMSPWWRYAFGEFYATGKQEFLIRVGRGGGKSTMLCRPAVVECLFGEHAVNPGEIQIWPLLSVDMDEANLKVGIVEAALAALGLRGEEITKHTRQQGRTKLSFLDAHERAMEVRVYPATVTAMSGPTLAGATNDEEAKWKADKDKGTNSAEEVLDAMGPAFRGNLKAHHVRCSSAYRTYGPHYEDIEAGDTESRHIARLGADFLEAALAGFERVAATELDPADAAEIRSYAATLTADSPNIPTWVANPTIDPIATRRRARNVRVWLREYGSRSSAEEDDGDFFDDVLLAEAARLKHFGGMGPCFAALDPGSRRNAFALAIVRRVELRSGWQWPPVLLREWVPAKGRPLDLRRDVLPVAAALCRQHGVELWVTDVHALTDVEIVGRQHGILTRCRAEGDAFEQEYRPVRDAIHRGECPLSGCEGAEELVRQLRLVRSAPGAAGHTRILSPEEGRLHGDLQRAYVSAAAEAGAGTYQAPNKDHGIGAIPGRYTAVDPRR